jgi:hypothetical protein
VGGSLRATARRPRLASRGYNRRRRRNDGVEPIEGGDRGLELLSLADRGLELAYARADLRVDAVQQMLSHRSPWSTVRGA